MGTTTPFTKANDNDNGDSVERSLDMGTVSAPDREPRPRYPPHITAVDATSNASATAVKQRNSKPITTYLTQFQLLSHREFLNLKRDWSLVLMHNAVAAVVGVFVGGLYFNVDTTISGFQVS